jgi:hypothetical protein
MASFLHIEHVYVKKEYEPMMAHILSLLLEL